MKKYQDPRVKKQFYQLWETANKIFCNGKIFTGSENHKLLASVSFITIPSILFYIFMSPEFAKNGQNGYTVVFVIIQLTIYVLLSITVCMDPGIIPKIRPDYEMQEELLKVPQKYSKLDYRFIVDSKMFIINAHQFKLKYCSTCAIYRPARASHCPSCDNCVVRFDHHCPWIGQCIGRRNYVYFYFFIMSVSFMLIFVFGTCVSYIVEESKKRAEYMDTSDAISETITQNPVSIILVIYSFGFSCFVVGLWLFHTYLVITNMTTNEYLKKHWIVESKNPFRRQNILKNIVQVLTFISQLKFLELKQNIYEVRDYMQSPIHTQNHVNEANDSSKCKDEEQVQTDNRNKNNYISNNIQMIKEIKS
ncbi:unnamed protein product [Paramecium pentaurelia]|uniref:Palmitoyltransferase n=1 Tax=Paramecium pentaurelia TaxID=43138 RepID=A0A8S1S8W8_9CILI|nr:unnamed protein product [Paramecium pentaurelia]